MARRTSERFEPQIVALELSVASPPGGGGHDIDRLVVFFLRILNFLLVSLSFFFVSECVEQGQQINGERQS